MDVPASQAELFEATWTPNLCCVFSDTIPILDNLESQCHSVFGQLFGNRSCEITLNEECWYTVNQNSEEATHVFLSFHD
jgi:hypothetical protein